MKIIFFSDLHGSEYYTKKAINLYQKEEGNTMVLLGDLLYHGPRNPLPEEYNPKGVIELLNSYKKEIIAVRGNCDSEVDQMVLEFPMMADYIYIINEQLKIFATHGHLWNAEKKPLLNKKDILIHGHTHIPVAELNEDIFVLNPGSMSLPKNNFPPTYGILNKNKFAIKNLEGSIVKEIDLK